MISFGDNFKKLRKEKNMTQDEIAKMFYLNKSSISRYEKNKQVPEIELLEKFADFFSVSVDYLLGRSPYRNSKGMKLTDDELEIVKFIKSDLQISALFHELISAPDEKVKELIKYWKYIKND